MPTACAPMMSVSMRSPTKTGRPAPERRSASSMSGRNGLPTTSGSWSTVLRTAWIAAPAPGTRPCSVGRVESVLVANHRAPRWMAIAAWSRRGHVIAGS